MKQSGKTRFYRYLQGKPYVESETTVEPYEEFEYMKKNGDSIIIKKGKDIGGSEDFTDYYESMIKESDILVFCFDMSKYLKDSKYEKKANARFEFICKKNKELGRSKANFVKLATHMDQISNSKNAIKEFNARIEKKYYKNDFKYNMFPIDITNTKDLERVIDKIF